jgi:hypothetical protein
MSMLLVLGAGASYGSDSKGTPPLGGALFDELRKFNPQGWGALPISLQSIFSGDFEAGMVELNKTHSHSLPVLQRAMAAFFFNWQARTTNIYIDLAKRIKATGWNGAICTLNYERLLEQCVSHVGLRPVVGTSSKPGHDLEICFPHGCCHLFCDSVTGAASAVSFAGMNVQTNGSIRAISDPREYQSRITQDAFPPVMSYFEPSKRTSSGANFIASQRQRYRDLVDFAETVVVVGIRVRPQDLHVWEPLAKTGARVVYCSGKTAGLEFTSWEQNRRLSKQNTVLGGYFKDEIKVIADELSL